MGRDWGVPAKDLWVRDCHSTYAKNPHNSTIRKCMTGLKHGPKTIPDLSPKKIYRRQTSILKDTQ